MKTVVDEIMRRAKRQRQIQLELIKKMEEERSEVNQLKQANQRLSHSLNEKDLALKSAEAQKRNMVQDASQKDYIDKLIAEITQLKEHLQILEQRLSVQSVSESHGYF